MAKPCVPKRELRQGLHWGVTQPTRSPVSAASAAGHCRLRECWPTSAPFIPDWSQEQAGALAPEPCPRLQGLAPCSGSLPVLGSACHALPVVLAPLMQLGLRQAGNRGLRLGSGSLSGPSADQHAPPRLPGSGLVRVEVSQVSAARELGPPAHSPGLPAQRYPGGASN